MIVMNQFFPSFTILREVRGALVYGRNEAKKKIFPSVSVIAFYLDLNGFQLFFFMTEDFLLLPAAAISLRNHALIN